MSLSYRDRALSKEVGLFIERGIDNYTVTSDMKLWQIKHKYFTENNGGFLVLINEHRKPIGYLELSDLNMLNTICSISLKYSEDLLLKKIDELKKDRIIKFREDFVEAEETVESVLNKLNNKNRTYFPVTRDGFLVGRFSKRILRDKLDKLYS